MNRLTMIGLVLGLVGCGVSREELTEDLTSLETRARAERKKEATDFAAALAPLVERKAKDGTKAALEEYDLPNEKYFVDMETRVRGDIERQHKDTREAVGAVGKGILDNQDAMLERLKKQDAELIRIYESVNKPSAGPSGGGSFVGGGPVGNVKFDGAKWTYDGPGSLQEAERLIKQQRARREREAKERRDRYERDALLKAALDKSASYNALNARVGSLEERLPTDLARIEGELSVVNGRVTRLGDRLDGALEKLDKLAQSYQMTLSTTPPVPMPPAREIHECDGWKVYPNRRNRVLHAWFPHV